MMRYVGAENFGVVTSANAIITICLVFTTFGWPVLLTRLFATGHRPTAVEGFRRAVLDAVAMTCAVAAVLFALFYVGVLKTPTYYFLLLPTLIFLRTIGAFVKAVVDGLGKVIVEQYMTGIAFPFMTIACFIIAGKLQTVSGIFIVFCLSASIGILILGGMATRYARSGLTVASAPEGQKRSQNWWLMSAGLSNVVLLNTDIIILGHFVPQSTIAVYGIIGTVVAIMTMAITAGNALFAPIIVKQYQAGDDAHARETFVSVQKHVLLLSTPFFVVACLFPGPILGVLTGGTVHAELSHCLMILAVAQLINAGTGPVATSLYMKGEITFFAKSLISAALLNVAGNLWLVPKYGVIGAAVSTATAISLANVIQYVRAKQLKIA
jgi:O-antigen/teichoic acid export membrane protein